MLLLGCAGFLSKISLRSNREEWVGDPETPWSCIFCEVCLGVRKANLFEGKLSSSSGFLVLEQSCWFFHFSWQQVLPIVCGKQAGCAASLPRCSVLPHQRAELVTPGNKHSLCLRKNHPAGKTGFNSVSSLGRCLLASTETFPGLWTCHCPPMASPLPGPPPSAGWVRGLFPQWHFNWVTYSAGNGQVFMVLVSGLLWFLPGQPFRSVDFKESWNGLGWKGS